MNGLNVNVVPTMFFPKQSNSVILAEKKKSILLENKMNHDRHKMISLVLNKEAK